MGDLSGDRPGVLRGWSRGRREDGRRLPGAKGLVAVVVAQAGRHQRRDPGGQTCRDPDTSAQQADPGRRGAGDRRDASRSAPLTASRALLAWASARVRAGCACRSLPERRGAALFVTPMRPPSRRQRDETPGRRRLVSCRSRRHPDRESDTNSLHRVAPIDTCTPLHGCDARTGAPPPREPQDSSHRGCLLTVDGVMRASTAPPASGRRLRAQGSKIRPSGIRRACMDGCIHTCTSIDTLPHAGHSCSREGNGTCHCPCGDPSRRAGARRHAPTCPAFWRSSSGEGTSSSSRRPRNTPATRRSARCSPGTELWSTLPSVMRR